MVILGLAGRESVRLDLWLERRRVRDGERDSRDGV